MAGAASAQLSIGSDALRQIAARSIFLHERLAATDKAAGGIRDRELEERWRACLGADGLARRLSWLKPATAVEHARDGVEYRPTESREWIDLLAEALAATPSAEPGNYSLAASPVAFEELLVPFVEAGRRRLRREAGEAFVLLSEAAQTTLERSLLLLLSHLSLGVFNLEFALHQSLAGRFPWPAGRPSDRFYRRFVADMLAGGLLEIMREYAALARLLSSCACHWARSHAQLLQRLQDDWPAIMLTFGLAGRRCRIEGIAPYRSDPHDGGRAVAIIALPDARRLVYKPRSVDMEAGLGELLAWANACGFSQAYRPVALLARDGYGWMEYVASEPCRAAAQIDNFYARTGGLICLMALLQGTDFHHENLIASGDQPVIVDPETLFHPRMPPEVSVDLGPGSRRSAERDDCAGRLAETGFLPSGQGPDFSALGATGPVETSFRVARCEAANSDAMAINYETYRVPRRDNVPILNGRPETAAAHRHAIVAGYREMARLVLRHRPSLLAAIGRFAGRRGRMVARSTNTYGLLLQAALRPELMRDGAARGIFFERLRSAAVRRKGRPPCWPILDAELRALERLDVPYLVSACDRPDACWPSPLEEAIARVEQITPASIEKAVRQLARMLSRLRTESMQASVPVS